MLQIGTCASGGPYVSARECPDGTERRSSRAHRRDHRPLRRGRDLPHPRHAAGQRRRPRTPGSSLVLDGPLLEPRGRMLPRRLGPGRRSRARRQEGGLIVGFMGLILGIGGLAAIGLWARRRARRSRPGACARSLARGRDGSRSAAGATRRSPRPRALRPGHAHRRRVRDAEEQDRARGLSVVAERSFNPVPIIVHALAIVARAARRLVRDGRDRARPPRQRRSRRRASSSAPAAVAGNDPRLAVFAAQLSAAISTSFRSSSPRARAS